MLKRALKFSISLSIGVTLGLVIIPRFMMFSNIYNETYPPIFIHAGLSFVVSFFVSFLISLFNEWVKSKFVSK